MGIGMMKLRLDANGFVRNDGDCEGDDITGIPDAIRELRRETVGLIRAHFSKGGGNTCVKVSPRGRTRATAGGWYNISGYVTRLQDINNQTAQEICARLGIDESAYRNGMDVFFVHGHLAEDQIGPRYTTGWPQGVSPAELLLTGAKNYDPSYPPSEDPVFQCVIYRNHPAKAQLMATLNWGEKFSWPRPKS